uniref:Fibronectin type-III domain-containing protein n=1 Tax=Caenorhabditis tropicalis TaxID=1561998 RepID=A0A1I7UM66_9PELO
MSDEHICFFAGRRCFQANGTTLLILFGLSPNEKKIFQISEKKLLFSNIRLGGFLTAVLTSDNTLMDFKPISYPISVTVEDNFALMKFPTALATRDNEGVLVFQTKSFGSVRSVNQELPTGIYDVVIKSIDSTTNYNITLCAEVIGTSPSASNMIPTLNCYEVPDNRLFMRNEPPKQQSSNLYESISSYFSKLLKNSSSKDDAVESNESDYTELQNFTSSTSDSLSELIRKLPEVHLHEPIPKPRTITPLIEPKVNFEQKPIMKVQPNNKIGNANVPKVMKAFVCNIHEHLNTRNHFLWICDIKQEAIFKQPGYELDVGHSFEGVFQIDKKSKVGWKCIEYIKSIPPLINGSIVDGRIEFRTTVSNYPKKNGEIKYPHAFSKHLGVVIDRYSLLSPNCNGQKVIIKRRRLDGKQYEWIITDLA